MGKKKSSVAHKETYQRINYLYQAAYLVLTTDSSNHSLCRFYTKTLKAIARRLVLRLHPNIKRTICKNCFLLLIPGVTTITRIKGKKDKYSETKCLGCGFKIHYMANPNYKPWFENPEAWIPTGS
ncbi:hypothetical protein LOTGIDRAFT_204481 [Lottia gigantea]|uniref:Uncharacterized protein n=1 Tax=Lottia gigantea TaxID=225164 RepID=V3ZSW7_LOTGI|nr:hypothetical protein LOTGIDRAFT_204481 [Lottia gigantea]ESO87442.1 hypothetical protein LOTGIDRAFT_204481 [Lottia gigantea]